MVRALKRAAVKDVLTPDDNKDIKSTKVDTIMLPGVSSFDPYVTFLQQRQFVEDILDARLNLGVKIVGICAGAQVLFESSEEGNKSGLGFLQGRVQRIRGHVRVPHLGWNHLIPNDNHPMRHLLDGVDLSKPFYFSHSYRFPETEHALAYVDYGERFPVIVATDQFVAIQFHPEKSYNQGVQLLKNVCQLC